MKKDKEGRSPEPAGKGSMSEAARRLFERHFIGAAFKDALFHTNNNQREIACAWKIMSSVMHFGPLANGSWRGLLAYR